MSMSGSRLGTMVVRIAADMLGYKADLGEAADATSAAAQKIEGATGKAIAAAGRMNGSMGDAAQAAGVLHGAAGMAGVGIELLAVGLAAASYAAYKGAQENQAYLKALIMTGNAAGTTAGQMADMARNIGHSVGTQYEAAAALAKMAGSGQVAAGSLQKFSQVAVEMERTVGQSVGDTVKVFAELGQEPVKASMKLNESMNYLTASTFEQIKAAQDLGDKEAAASIAQDAYATAMKTRTDQIKDNLGTLETAWLVVKDAAKRAWDSMLNIGREETAGDKLAKVQKRIEEINFILDKPGLTANWGDGAGLQKELAGLGAQAAALGGVAAQSQAAAQAEGERAAIQKAGISAIDAVSKANEAALSRQDKLTNALKDYRGEIEKIRAANPSSVLLDAEKIKKAEDYIRSKYAEKSATAGRKDNSAAREMEKEAALLATLAGVNADYQLQLTRLQAVRAKGTLSEQGYVEAVEQLIAKQPMAAKLMADAAKQTQAVEKANLAAAEAHEKYIDSLDKGLDKLKAEVLAQQEQNDRLGLSKEAIAALDGAKLDLMATELERQAIRALDKNLDQAEYSLIMQQAKAYRELASAKASGAAKATTIDAAKEAQAEWSKTAEKINDTLTDALMRGFESGKDFAKNLRDTVVNMFNTMVLRPVISAVMNPIAQGVTGMLGLSGAANGASAVSTGASVLSSAGTIGGAASAFGGAFSAGAAIGTEAFSAGVTMMTEASGLSSFMAGAGQTLGAVGPAGWVALAALAVVALGNNTKSTSGTGEGSKTYDALGNVAGTTSSSSWGGLAPVDQSITALAAGYFATAASLGIKASGVQISQGSNTGRQGESPNFALGVNVNGASVYNSGETPTSAAAYSLAASRAVFAALQASELPKHLSGVFDDITASTANADQITAALIGAQALATFHTALQSLPFDSLKDLTYGATKSLIEFSGGLDKLQTNLAGYYDNFTSDADKLKLSSSNLALGFAAMGIQMPVVNSGLKDWYKLQVDAAMALNQSVPANARATAGLLALQGSVASLGNSAITAADAIIKMVTGITDSVDKSLFNMQYGMADNAGKYGMLDVRAASASDQMLASTDINTIATLAQTQIDLVNQAWGLLDATQQKETYLQFEDKLNKIDAFVVQSGATALDLQGARDDKTAATIATAVEDGVAKGIAAAAQQIADAAAAIIAQAQKPVVAVAEVSVSVSAPAGSEVSVTDRWTDRGR